MHTQKEQLLAQLLNSGNSIPYIPRSIEEQYLAILGGQELPVPVPRTRVHVLLDTLVSEGIPGGGNGGGQPGGGNITNQYKEAHKALLCDLDMEQVSQQLPPAPIVAPIQLIELTPHLKLPVVYDIVSSAPVKVPAPQL